MLPAPYRCEPHAHPGQQRQVLVDLRNVRAFAADLGSVRRASAKTKTSTGMDGHGGSISGRLTMAHNSTVRAPMSRVISRLARFIRRSQNMWRALVKFIMAAKVQLINSLA